MLRHLCGCGRVVRPQLRISAVGKRRGIHHRESELDGKTLVIRAVASSNEELLLQRHRFVLDVLADTELSARQREIAAFLILGVSRADVARRLEIRPYTLQNHIAAIYNKFAIRNTGALSGIIMGRLVDWLVQQEQVWRGESYREGQSSNENSVLASPVVRGAVRRLAPVAAAPSIDQRIQMVLK